MQTFLVVVLSFLAPALALAQSSEPCPRFTPGSVLTPPPDLFSFRGKLNVILTYNSRLDNAGNTLYCFTTADGRESPTLHLHPGDDLVIHLKNNLPPGATMTMATIPEMSMSPSAAGCDTSVMTTNSVNIHYHGTNVPPSCHQDEVIKTAVDGGKSFDYSVHIPRDEPPGLYWYHPHIHGLSEAAVLGGASGAIVIEGLEKFNRDVAGLPQQLLIIRDNLVPGNPSPGDGVPSWDVSVNYTPVSYPEFTPAVLPMRPGERQLWRVLNASADTILDLQLNYDGQAQPLEIVGLDGVPTGSQDGLFQGRSVHKKHLLLPPAGRAEFIITGPAYQVENALLNTRNVDTGPDGDADPARPLVRIQIDPQARRQPSMPASAEAPLMAPRFAHLADCHPTAHRKLYFSEVLQDRATRTAPLTSSSPSTGKPPSFSTPIIPPPSRPHRALWKTGPSKIVRSKITNFTSTKFTSLS